MHTRRVVVTGMGVVSPIGNTIDEMWDSLIHGVSGATPITKFDASLFKTRFACEVKNFDPLLYGIDKKEARRIDLFSQYALASAYMAINDSNLLSYSGLDKDKVAVIWGSGNGGVQTIFEELKEFFEGDGTPRFSPFYVPKSIADIPSGHISMHYGFTGASFATLAACATSTNAIIEAYYFIKYGRADVVVSGGSEAAINPIGIGGFNGLHALSTKNENPTTASRPFDKKRDGFVMGEGGACLVIEELEHAIARGATILAEITGTGLTSDAYHITAPHPEGIGAIKAMQMAIQQANISIQDVDYINAHATSTPVGDLAELKAISNCFKEHTPNVAISSTKSMTGHLLGGAGALEAIICILAIQHNIAPPTINLTEADTATIGVPMNLVPNVAQARKVDVALTNNFGFGGHNASILFQSYSEQ